MDFFDSDPMTPKILIITQHFPPETSGNASRIYDLSKNMVKLGAQVTVISPFPTFPHGSFKKNWKFYSSRKDNGIKHINIFTWQPTKSNPSFLSRIIYYLMFPLHSILWAFLKRREYDVIITSAPPIFTGMTGYLIKKITKKKWVFDVRDLWIDASVSLGFIKKGSFFEKVSRRYEMICYGVCDGISATTKELKNVIIKQNNVPDDKIVIISNGVDTKVFKPLNMKKNRIVYAGNIGYAQDLKKVILAVKKINEKVTIEFFLIGNGDIKKDLESLVINEGLEDIITFTGSLDRTRIPKLVAESLVGIAPLKYLDSLEYAVPTKVYEYMSCGIPFIATGDGEIENLVKSSLSGLIAKNNVESIYENIIYLIKNKKLMDEMGKNGREFVEKYYDRKKIAKDFLHYIEKVIT